MLKVNRVPSEEQLLTVSIKTAAAMIGIGRSTLYGLLDVGEIETIKVGRRRLVVVASLRAFVESKRLPVSTLPSIG